MEFGSIQTIFLPGRIAVFEPDRSPGIRQVGATPDGGHGLSVIFDHFGHVHVGNEQGAGFGHATMPEHSMSIGSNSRQVPKPHRAGGLVEQLRLGLLALINHENLVEADRLGGMDLFIRPATPNDLGIGGVVIVGNDLARAAPTQ